MKVAVLGQGGRLRGRSAAVSVLTAALAALVCSVPSVGAAALPAARPGIAEARVAPAGVAPAGALQDSTPARDLVFADEFSGRFGSRPDGRKWTYNVGNGTGGWGNGEREFYTSRSRNARLDGHGHLVISAYETTENTTRECWYGRCRFTSARLFTMGRFTAEYGRIAARIKLPRGSGLWPAFWALAEENIEGGGSTYTEMDIMEHVGSEPDRVVSSLHGASGSATMDVCTQLSTSDGSDYADDYHVFAADWTTTSITFSVDGRPFVTRNRAAYGSAWTFDRPMVLVLNLAVGGRWPGDPGRDTVFPARMLVDYVRVYAKASGAVASAAPSPPTHPGGCDRAVDPA